MKIYLVYSVFGRWAFGSLEKAEKKYKEQLDEMRTFNDPASIYTYKEYMVHGHYALFDCYCGDKLSHCVSAGIDYLTVE